MTADYTEHLQRFERLDDHTDMVYDYIRADKTVFLPFVAVTSDDRIAISQVVSENEYNGVQQLPKARFRYPGQIGDCDLSDAFMERLLHTFPNMVGSDLQPDSVRVLTRPQGNTAWTKLFIPALVKLKFESSSVAASNPDQATIRRRGFKIAWLGKNKAVRAINPHVKRTNPNQMRMKRDHVFLGQALEHLDQ